MFKTNTKLKQEILTLGTLLKAHVKMVFDMQSEIEELRYDLKVSQDLAKGLFIQSENLRNFGPQTRILEPEETKNYQAIISDIKIVVDGLRKELLEKDKIIYYLITGEGKLPDTVRLPKIIMDE